MSDQKQNPNETEEAGNTKNLKKTMSPKQLQAAADEAKAEAAKLEQEAKDAAQKAHDEMRLQRKTAAIEAAEDEADATRILAAAAYVGPSQTERWLANAGAVASIVTAGMVFGLMIRKAGGGSTAG